MRAATRVAGRYSWVLAKVPCRIGFYARWRRVRGYTALPAPHTIAPHTIAQRGKGGAGAVAQFWPWCARMITLRISRFGGAAKVAASRAIAC